MGRNNNLIDLTGRTYGGLLVVRRAGAVLRNDGHRQPTWECHCVCGETVVVLGHKLREGKRKACGVNGHKYSSPMNTLTVAERRIWRGMLARCSNPKLRAFRYYGAKGVKVCARWRKDFANFLSDMGPRPSLEHTLDRIDPFGDYEPANCRWALPKVQDRNKRNTVRVVFQGEQITVADYAEKMGLSSQMIRKRLGRGWSIEDALTQPAQTWLSSLEFAKLEEQVGE